MNRTADLSDFAGAAASVFAPSSPVSLPSDLAGLDPASAGQGEFAELAAAVRSPPDGDREALALRAWEQLDAGDFVAVLGCSQRRADSACTDLRPSYGRTSRARLRRGGVEAAGSSRRVSCRFGSGACLMRRSHEAALWRMNGEPRQGAVPAHPDGAGAVLGPVLVVGDGVTQHELGVVAGGAQLERDEAELRIAGLPGQL